MIRRLRDRANKVKFNIKNVYYAIKSTSGKGYETPVPIPGAVSISLEPQGEMSPFYADGIKYYITSSNSGYEGDLETALIPDSFRKDVLKEIEDKKKVLFENADTEPTTFALGFQIDGDTTPTLFWFYECTATRPSASSQTNEDTKTPQTDTITVTVSPRADGIVRAKTTEESYTAVKDTWFTTVYEKDAS